MLTDYSLITTTLPGGGLCRTLHYTHYTTRVLIEYVLITFIVHIALLTRPRLCIPIRSPGQHFLLSTDYLQPRVLTTGCAYLFEYLDKSYSDVFFHADQVIPHRTTPHYTKHHYTTPQHTPPHQPTPHHTTQVIRGLYEPFLRDWVGAFPNTSLVLRSEDLIDSPHTHQRRLLRFLGLNVHGTVVREVGVEPTPTGRDHLHAIADVYVLNSRDRVRQVGFKPTRPQPCKPELYPHVVYATLSRPPTTQAGMVPADRDRIPLVVARAALIVCHTPLCLSREGVPVCK